MPISQNNEKLPGSLTRCLAYFFTDYEFPQTTYLVGWKAHNCLTLQALRVSNVLPKEGGETDGNSSIRAKGFR